MGNRVGICPNQKESLGCDSRGSVCPRLVSVPVWAGQEGKSDCVRLTARCSLTSAELRAGIDYSEAKLPPVKRDVKPSIFPG